AARRRRRRPPQSGAAAVRPRRLRARPGSGVLALLPDAGLLAGEVAQVVQLRAADVAAGDDLDLVDGRGVHGEHALDADAEGHLADAEGLAHAVALATDDVALEDLDTGAVALDDLHVHLDVVAGAECGDVLAQGRLVELVELLHVLSPALRLRSDGVVLGAPRPGRPCGTVDPARSGLPVPVCWASGGDSHRHGPARPRVAPSPEAEGRAVRTRGHSASAAQARQAGTAGIVPVITAARCRLRHGRLRRAGSGAGDVPIGRWQQVGATLAGPGEGLLPAPGGDPAVVAGQQDRRYLADRPGRIGPARRSRVERVLQQALGVGLLHERGGVADHARHQAHHGLGDREHRDLSAVEHVVAEGRQRHLAADVLQVLVDAFVDALVASAGEHQPLALGPF